jgi:polyhydroxybutyrate depolymerase
MLPASANAATSVGLASGRKYLLAVEQRGRFAGGATLILLPGLYNSPATLMEQTGFNHVGASMRWNVVYGETHTKSWNAGLCCGDASKYGTDDVAYLVDVVRSMRARGHYGPVYLAGFSNGGMMALRAGCDEPAYFPRVASVAGTLVSPCPGGLQRARHIHGTSDQVVPYEGGYSSFCKADFPPTRDEAGKVVPSLDYRLYSVDGGAHAWPPGATEYLRDFFAGRATRAAIIRGGVPVNG